MVSLRVLFGLLPALGAAVPSAALRRDVSSPLLEEFNRFSQYTAASNCLANHNGSSAGSPVYCDAGFCPLIKEADTEIIKGFWGLSPGDTTGYLALDRTQKLIVLAFRGTVSDENGWTDLMLGYTDAATACDGCKAHKGFWGASTAAMDNLTSTIDTAVAQNSDYKLVVTGHSLGGAIATLAAVRLRNAGHTLDLYTFGAPSVGNLAFAQYITDQGSGNNYRLTHGPDEVPKVLYKTSRHWLFHILVPEYSQSSPEYWITSGVGVSVAESDIKFIEGVNNETGNLGTQEVTMAPHGWYMGNMSVCAQT
ncbi:alpha/beta-hydrolase [Aspergillus avenaceus]|uniref:feruloyl esterase n=1 Tax=Aspergillus avenaceus TaxID=36643 RepID=A0A5N6TT77_ASPAV|nr:alpha/beta-hydrolase [Aspergillus avenaceus]